MKKLKQNGFVHIELIIVTLVIALVGGIGYYVWQRNSNQNKPAEAQSAYYAPVDYLMPNGIKYLARLNTSCVVENKYSGIDNYNKCQENFFQNFNRYYKYKYKTVLKNGPLDIKACRVSNNPSSSVHGVKVRAFYTKDYMRYRSVKTSANYTYMRLPDGQTLGRPGRFPNASKNIFWDGGGYAESNISHRTGEIFGLITDIKKHPYLTREADREGARIFNKVITGNDQISISAKNPLTFFFMEYVDNGAYKTKTKYINFLNIPKC